MGGNLIKPDTAAAIAEAIQRAERCERFTVERGEPCDGLEGCRACLHLAAAAVLEQLAGAEGAGC